MYKVLIPLDGSEFSRQILPQMDRFLEPEDCELILFRAAQPPKVTSMPELPPIPPAMGVGPGYGPGSPDLEKYRVYATQAEESLRVHLENELHPEARQLQDAGYTVSTEIRFGDPVVEIVRLVEDEAIDLVAMTTHGRSGLSRFLFGSVADGVLRSVSVPVMLLRSSVES